MIFATDVQASLGASLAADPVSSRQGNVRQVKPVVLHHGETTFSRELNLPNNTGLFGEEGVKRRFSAPFAKAVLPHSVVADSTPLQVWEGTVVEVDNDSGVMQVLLDSKIGQMPRHTAEIELDWVSDQDRDLVRPGAVFYLTLFKRSNPSVENAQELRFRRRPAWSASQIEQVEHDALKLREKLRERPIAP